VAASLGSIATNYALNRLFIEVLGWGHAGLALSTSLVATINFLALAVLLRSKIRRLEGRRLARSIGRVAAATAAMAAATGASSHVVRQWLGETTWPRVADLSLSIPLGLAVLYAACRALRVPELDAAVAATWGRARRARSAGR
jgi:putative peptidoglycan lipid II flippase